MVPCHRQLRTWIMVSEDDVGNRLSSGLAGVADPQDPIDPGVVLRERDVDGTARHEHEDDWPLGRLGHGGDELGLSPREEKGGPVQALGLHPLVEARDDDGGVGLARRLDGRGDGLVPAARDVGAAGLVRNPRGVRGDALQRRGVAAGLARVVPDHGDGGVGVRADDGDDAVRGGAEREHVPVVPGAAPVLEEHDALARRVERQVLVLPGAHVRGAQAPERPGRGVPVEHAEPHLHGDGVEERGVDVGVGDLARGDGGAGVEREERPAVEVEAGAERGGGGVLGGARVVLVAEEDVDGVAVGDDVAVQAPAPADGAAQERRVGARGHAVDLVVGAHDAGGAAVLDAGAEGDVEGVLQVLRRHHGVEVEPVRAAPLVQVVRREVLAAGGELEAVAVAAVRGGVGLLEAAHVGGGVARRDGGVLAGRLLAAAPPRVPEDVHVRGPEGEARPPAVVHGARLVGHRLQLHESSSVYNNIIMDEWICQP
uniref:Uncharacterized protein n=1 Tax=Zea mays TaxID=4577 RepID=A0A804NJJ5_MAIZE